MKTTPNLFVLTTGITLLILGVLAVIYMACRDNQMDDQFIQNSIAQEPLPRLTAPDEPSFSSMPVQESSRQLQSKPDPVHPSSFTSAESAPLDEGKPVVITDYQNWTLIAEKISSRNGYSVGTGKTGIAHRDGLFAEAADGFISHVNPVGQIDSIYIPNAARIKLPNGLVYISIDTALIPQPDGTYTLQSGSTALADMVDLYDAVVVAE